MKKYPKQLDLPPDPDPEPKLIVFFPDQNHILTPSFMVIRPVVFALSCVTHKQLKMKT